VLLQQPCWQNLLTLRAAYPPPSGASYSSSWWLQHLLACLPAFVDHAILGEEGGVLGNIKSDYLWYVCPPPCLLFMLAVMVALLQHTGLHLQVPRSPGRHLQLQHRCVPCWRWQALMCDHRRYGGCVPCMPGHNQVSTKDWQQLRQCVAGGAGTAGYQGFCVSVGVLRHSTPVAGMAVCVCRRRRRYMPFAVKPTVVRSVTMPRHACLSRQASCQSFQLSKPSFCNLLSTALFQVV
jgi:hypothetical protein